MSNYGVCKGCTQRYIGCHAKCLAYIDEKQKAEIIKAEYLKNKSVDVEFNNFRKEGALKRKKYHGYNR